MILIPVEAFAFGHNPTTSLIVKIGGWIDSLIPIALALALLYFFWGVAQTILKSNDSTAREEGRSKMLWGIVALFVMVSVWGLVAFLRSSLDINTPVGNTLLPPSVNRGR